MNRRARGFTLLEVLIALAIVALSVGALLGTVTSSASNIAYLREKTLAEWVALNRLTEIRIDPQLPSVGRRLGNSVMGGTRWEWEEEVTELPVKGLFRIEVRVRDLQEAVDDTRPVDKPSAQTSTPTKSSTESARSLDWMTTVTGVVSSSRSEIRQPVAAPFAGSPQNPGGQPGGPNPPKTGAPSS